DTLIEVQSFVINSNKSETLFAMSVNLLESDPSAGLITFPAALAKWVKIENLAISFKASRKPPAPPSQAG
ncbi:MAG: hypothetical protein KDM63_14670, partial [Verrucomicrobiae bacterium]|nr:hypothetical protein [Verrucomicrobiae bacterium]